MHSLGNKLHYSMDNYDLLSFNSFLTSPNESAIFSNIGVVTQSDQGNIWHCMFPREHSAPYTP